MAAGRVVAGRGRGDDRQAGRGPGGESAVKVGGVDEAAHSTGAASLPPGWIGTPGCRWAAPVTAGRPLAGRRDPAGVQRVRQHRWT